MNILIIYHFLFMPPGKERAAIKILFTFFVPSGGVETLNRQRCTVLTHSGIECHLLYYQTGAGVQNLMQKNDIPFFIASSDSDILNIVQHHLYDAIIVATDFHLLPKLRQAGYGGALIYESQGFGSREEAEITVTSAAPVLQSCCDGVLVPTTAYLVELFTRICPELRLFSIPNVLDTSSFHYVPNIPPSNPVVSWVGRLEPNKNWKHFLTISLLLRQRFPSLKLWMFYDDTLSQPEDRDQFEHWVNVYELSNILERLSNIPHHRMPHYYSMIGDSGGFLLSTSLLEGFGYAAAEAIICRCPVLSTDSDGVRAFIRHNETGKFYAHGNLDQAAAEGADLLTNFELRQHIRGQGRDIVATLLNVDSYVHSFRSMLHSVGVG
ncbi:glycosyltransferase family 4 protein [Paenibacillus jiagnxiensis]|uniref:glycosyltransferase family 4 protein n=1 Tax=Paenibacillus jiagnxiensis TaxID=3228926 RepID=UPI0034729CA6